MKKHRSQLATPKLVLRKEVIGKLTGDQLELVAGADDPGTFPISACAHCPPVVTK